MRKTGFFGETGLSQCFRSWFGPFDPRSMLAKIGVIALPVVRRLEDSDRLKTIIPVLPPYDGIVALTELRYGPIGISSDARHRLIEIRKPCPQDRAMTGFAHVRKNGEPALDVLVTIEAIVEVAQITHHVLGNTLYCRVPRSGRRRRS